MQISGFFSSNTIPQTSTIKNHSNFERLYSMVLSDTLLERYYFLRIYKNDKYF